MAKSNGSVYASSLTQSVWQRKLIAWVMLVLTATQPVLASAEVIADPGAPGQNRPLVESTANNIPIVQITTPSAAGVSRNLYQQLQVDHGGFILNNSGGITQTQLAGYVGGNPNIGSGPAAKVILNEVTGSNPSYLRGYTEVAGQKAEVVIANPNGIYGDGFGFINTSRAILTTGAPVFGGSGSLEAFRVTGGQISIQGAGMNASDTDQVDLISRSVAVNAGVWAKNLNVVAGSNKVDANTLHAETIPGDAAIPQLAIDVGQLGGMYAQRIYLVGTENGVGVNSKGTLTASAGDIIISNAGKVEFQGNTSASNHIQITAAGDISNQSVIQAGGNLSVQGNNIENAAGSEMRAQNSTAVTAAGTLTNRGLIDGTETRVAGTTINNIGTGRIYGDHLAIQAGTLTNGEEGGTAATIAARNRLDIGAQTITNREHALLFSGGDMAIGGSLDGNNRATGQAATLNNNSATIEALKDLDISAQQINNTNEHFTTAMVTAGTEYIVEYQGTGNDNGYTPPSLLYRAGTPGLYTYVDESVHLNVPTGTRYNQWALYQYTRTTVETRVQTSDPGKILAGKNLNLTSGTVTNNKSTMIAGGDITGTVGSLNNIEIPGVRTFTDSGTAIYYWRNHRSGSDDTGSSSAGYNPAQTQENFSLSTTTYQDNTTPAGTGTTLAGNTPSLFSVTPNSTSQYFIETDPRFINYRQWLSSDYMLQALAADPSTIQKRLGDGFYEQKLIREQVSQLTGQRFLNGYTDDEAQYTALMNNGATFAQEQQLTVGVALTAAQMAKLTSDIVWLVEKEVTLPDGQTTKALVPQVYARNVQAGDLTSNGALLAGKNVQLTVGTDLTNSGTIAGRNSVSITAENINNLGGQISGSDVSLTAHTDINNLGGQVTAANQLTLDAGRDVNVTSTTSTQTGSQGSRTNINRVGGLSVTGDNGSMQITSGRDVNLTAAEITNSGQGGTTQLTAGRDLNLGTVTESVSQHTVWDADNQRKESSRADAGTTIQTQGTILLTAGNNVNAKAAAIQNSQGEITVTAGQNINITAGEAAQSIDESHKSVSHGFFSSTTYTSHYANDATAALASTLSGDTVTLQAGNDIGIKGSHVAGTNDVTIKAQQNVSITAAQQDSQTEHMQKEVTSGLFGSGGFGFTIGKRSEKTTNGEQSQTQAGSTVGSLAGNVSITAGGSVESKGATLIAGKDIDITGKEVTIENTTDVYNNKYRYEFEQSGLTVSLGGKAVDAATKVGADIRRSGEVEDTRLQALYQYKAVQDLKALGTELDKGASQTVALNVSLGSSSMTSEQTAHTEIANPSNISAGGNVTITATEKDITLKGTKINATDITLDAARDLNIEAAQNLLATTGTNSASSASLGWSFGANPGAFGSVGSSNGKENETTVTHTGSVINASGTATLESGNDTNIIGSQVKGEKVVANIGGNLNIVSLQDTNDYTAKNQSSGIGFSTGDKGGVSGSISKGNTDSTYASVTEQAGIYAGQEGFDIQVGKNTDLKGAVISSEATPDKNKLSTDTLTYSDIENKAEYSASSSGVAYDSRKYQPGDENYKNQGLIPVMGVSSAGNADSTTKSAISPGTIEVRSNPNQDLSNLSRDIDNTLNALGKIFDKQTVQEQRELAQLFGEEAFKAIGKLGLIEGSPEKAFLDAFAGGLMAQLGGGSFASGAAGAGFNQLVQLQLAKITDPALHQWASAVVGIAAASVVGGNAQTGASTAVSETRNNWFSAAHVLARTAAISAFRYLSSTPAGRAALQKLEIYSEDALIASEAMMANVVNEANGLMTRFGVPGRIQSRINLITGDAEAGWEHVLARHFNSSVNASQFTVAPEELQGILQSEQVVGSQIVRVLVSDQGPRFIREVTLDKIIGIDKFTNLPTSVMTILTDLQGNLITATPGVIK